MGTNFYLLTKSKDMALKYAPMTYCVTDFPEFGYSIHVAKTSCGWLPLFQAHKDGICSVKEYREAYDTGEFIIYDEYGDKYNWEEFDERVLKFNGGTLGSIEPEKFEQAHDELMDNSMPDYIPVSHIRGTKQSYRYRFIEDDRYIFVDKDGYEFDLSEFS